MSQTSAMGPLGPLQGMYFDPSRNRYFPMPKDALPPPTPGPSSPGYDQPPQPSRRGPSTPRNPILPPTGCDYRGLKRAKYFHSSGAGEVAPGPRVRSGRMIHRGRRACDVDRHLSRHYAGLELQNTFSCSGCQGEQITSVNSFVGGSFYVTTDHGKIVIHKQDGQTHGISVCATNLVGVHIDIARMTIMAIAGGPEAHIHHFRRDPENLDYVFMQHSELDLPQGDIFSSSSFDGSCVLGASKSLTTITYAERVKTSRRSLLSDALAVHQSDPNLVFAGLRNGSVSLEDLRVQSKQINRVGGTVRQKAVVGVRRLADSAVPWGLVVSGLSDELLVYDIRYASSPLHACPGHINKFHDKLGLATTPDDKYIYAAGSDHRLRLFSTQTGDRIMPTPPLTSTETFSTAGQPSPHPDLRLNNFKIGPDDPNPLKRIFPDKVESICVREDDMGLDVGVKGDLLRFGAVRGDGWVEYSPRDARREEGRGEGMGQGMGQGMGDLGSPGRIWDEEGEYDLVEYEEEVVDM